MGNGMALSEVEARYSLLQGPWRTVWRRDGSCVVYPPGDDILHTLDGDACPCGPTPQLLDMPCDCDHWMYAHHALDGRE